ncbi:hypothetical protein AB5N19_11232, partial [Seiridium cardinale]
LIGYWLAWCIYSLHFHPLSKYPGPKLAAISELWYATIWTGGNWPFVMENIHRRYGNIVRIAPNELSFSSAQSFRDIYGTPSKARKLFPKSELFYDHGEFANIAYERDPEKYAVKRKMFAPGFSPRALRDQEHLIHQHVDSFLQQIERLASGPSGMNVTEALEWVTFDIMGELTFGESFGAVREARPNYWVSILLDAVYGGSVAGLKNRLPVLKHLLPFLIPKDAVEKYTQHHAMTLEKVRHRIKIGDANNREDLFASVIRDKSMSEDQLAAEANVFLTAGAETTATTLTAALYFLAANPNCLARLRDELNSSFRSVDEINGDNTAGLTYLNAILEETLRIFPPSPVGPPRKSPGEIVDGIFIPQGVYVSTDITSLHRDPKTVPSPLVWKPERWVGEGGRPYTVPFSIGPRACVGINLAWLEMRIILSKIVYSLDFSLVGEPGYWPDKCRLRQLWKKAPLIVRFQRRGKHTVEG